MDIREVKDLIAKGEIRNISVRYIDFLGKMKHVVVSASYFNKVMEKGVGIDGSSIPGFASISNSDMRVKPDLSSAFLDPLYDGMLSVIGDVYYSHSETVFEKYPRHVLKNALRFMKDEGIADEIYALGELEFYLFKDVFFDDNFFAIDFKEDLPLEKGYHVSEPYDTEVEFRNMIVEMLEGIDIRVKYHHHEVGTKGQHEVELFFAPMISMADAVEVSKYIIKEMAVANEMYATFMPKPLYGEAGSGLHFHFYPVKDGKNIFYMRVGKLNDMAKHFIGGILKHAKSLTAFTNPSTNSFKRLLSGFEAPTSINYSIANRSSAIRIPGYSEEKSVDIEYRPPDATMNTYFGLAAILMAGMDGVINKFDPGEPVTDNAYKNTDKYERLPETLCTALDEIEKDHGYLLRGNVFTEELIAQWIKMKREEYRKVNLFPAPVEFKLYF